MKLKAELSSLTWGTYPSFLAFRNFCYYLSQTWNNCTYKLILRASANDSGWRDKKDAQQGRGKTKHLIRRTIAQHVHLKLSKFRSCPLQNKTKLSWSDDKSLDDKIFKLLFGLLALLTCIMLKLRPGTEIKGTVNTASHLQNSI